MVTHLVGWAPAVVTAVMSASNSSLQMCKFSGVGTGCGGSIQFIFANVQIVLLSVICLKILLQGSGTLCILKKQEIHGDVAKKHCLAKLLFHGLNPTCAGFVVWTLVLCFVFRFLITFTLTFLVNWLRKGIKPINWQVCLSNYYVINNLFDFFIFKTTVIFQYV